MTRNDERRTILLIGADFRNQGAYLMMVAAMNEIRYRFEATPVLSFRTGTPIQRHRVGALTLLPISGRIPKGGRVEKFGGRLGAVTHQDIDAVFDASGFFYSDSWKQFVDGRAGLLRTFADMGTPVYLLPQAFGPFEHTARACGEALSAGRIAYPRDRTSAAHVRTLVAEQGLSTRVETSPDFTCLVHGTGEEWGELSGSVPIVPNYNIVARAPDGDAARAYVDNLVAYVTAARRAGRTVYGLSHEGRKDTRILREVARRVGDLRIVTGFDGVQLKALLGTAPYAIVGRYHAAVSCLSQSTPLIAHGWSHKYQHLMEDFGQQTRLLDPFVPVSADDAQRHVEELEGFSGVDLTDLGQCAEVYRERALTMWADIEADLLAVSASSHVGGSAGD